MNAVLETLSKIGIVPVIKIDDPSKAVPLARALAAGGIPCAEVTFRTAEGEEAIKRIAADVPEVLVGAGTVLTTQQVDKAIAAGAKFIVSPGFNPKIVAYCNEKKIPITPGCANPSDIEQAIEAGLDVVKFFPAEQVGGLDYIKAIAAPYGKIKFMPTGGINAGNITKYIAYEKILACGGSWMVTPELIAAGNFEKITDLCREAVQSMLGYKMVHIGINSASKDEAEKSAKLFGSLFGFVSRETSKSYFSGDEVEIMNLQGRGKHGHIAIGTWSVPRAIAHLERQGIEFDPSTIQKAPNGDTNFIYLKDEILGFAVHLVTRK
jgi:2-dehydro-3-deoxyphosphogluconate aldolase/(4S)-4-hydroxy-2-oxoglutarate aldolase